MLSFVVPAHNEETLIGRTLKAISAAAEDVGEPFEIIVVDDASTDQTSTIAAANGARILSVNKRQIAAVRNAGGREAKGSWLIFVDADTVVTPEVVRAAVKAMKSGFVGGGCRVDFDGRVPSYAAVVQPALVWLFRKFRIACGCFLFCTREAFYAAEGFNEELFASEEISMSLRLGRIGKFVVLMERVITSGRKLRTYSGIEVVWIFGSFALRGAKSVKQRDGLDLWYGERRPDPDPVPRTLLSDPEY